MWRLSWARVDGARWCCGAAGRRGGGAAMGRAVAGVSGGSGGASHGQQPTAGQWGGAGSGAARAAERASRRVRGGSDAERRVARHAPRRALRAARIATTRPLHPAMTPPPSGGRIVQLPPSVVNRIAAGEIIVHPANALKELLENAIDAGATAIDILVKDGGLKLLQITDNGSGIARADLAMLCQRFATSKLTSFEDLRLIATYGFRGEALASILHIARLLVVSKVPQEALAYRAWYLNGRLVPPKGGDAGDAAAAPRPVAGTNGTTLTVEDLFYNAPARLRATRSKNDEFIRILDVAGCYAVHCAVGVSCKKFGELHAALATRPGLSLKERIRTVYGSGIASNLLEFAETLPSAAGLRGFKGALTTSSYTNKKKTPPVLFINDRLVLCDPLRRLVASIYAYFLPKGHHPFVYLSLDIEPHNVDVNVHPTKKEVRFLHEDEIVAAVSAKVHSMLSQVDTLRTFQTQTILTRKRNAESELGVTLESLAPQASLAPQPKKTRQENKLVRTDARQLKLGSFIAAPQLRPPLRPQLQAQSQPQPQPAEANLASIAALKASLVATCHKGLTEIFNGCTYVGIIDERRRLCSFQHGVRLFVCDYASVLSEFYYQVALSAFGQYGEVQLAQPLALEAILVPLYDAAPRDGVALRPRHEVIAQLLDLREMFADYFRLRFTASGALASLPLILKSIDPPTSKLGLFLYRLAQIDYSRERSCLEGVMRQIALLYVPEPIDNARDASAEQREANSARRSALDNQLENHVFPLLQQRFVATGTLVHDVVQIADLPGLYRVFERC
jgi:DNA mismatch repair protein MLH1